MPTVLVAIHLVRRPSDRRAWVLFVLLSAALMGAKATFIPVLGGGILLVLGWRLVTGRRDQLATVLLGAVLAAELVFAQLVLFGGPPRAGTGGRVNLPEDGVALWVPS